MQLDDLIAFVRALGIIYYIFTGPFFNMLHGNGNYADLHVYVQKMLQCFDPSDILLGSCRHLLR